MRLMQDQRTGASTLVCLHCGAEMAPSVHEVLYCYCRNSGVNGDVVSSGIPAPSMQDAA